MVLRGVPEDGRQTSSAGGHHVFCALTLLDHRPLDWDPTGLSPRRDRFRRSVRRARGLCRLSRGGDPRAWAILPANQPGAWRREWLRLLRLLRPAIPKDWTVLVLTDRGLYARWL